MTPIDVFNGSLMRYAFFERQRVPPDSTIVDLLVVSERLETNRHVFDASCQAQKRVLPFRRVAAGVISVRRWTYCLSRLRESKTG
jgi:hypothetical protein